MTDLKVGVGIVVRSGQDHILLGKRKGAHGAGQWALPGGAVEPNESPYSAAERELMEETGLNPCNLHSLNCWTFDKFEFAPHYITLYYESQRLGEEVPALLEPDKCDGWEWFPLDQVPRNLFPGTTQAIAFLRRRK